jgi:protein-L-isoaspartate(D-aspartate) O-methyltransferase
MITTATQPGTGPDDTARMRAAMAASQLRPTAVSDNRVVAAMASVPRERFLPAAARAAAYRDTAIPLGHGRYQNTPMATGRLLTRSELIREDRVLLIGAAGGYTAAVLAAMGAQVVAVEEHPALAALARTALADLPEVTLVEAPLAEGAAAHAPFDVMVVDGAVEELPSALVEQVRPEGRIVAGLLERGVTRLAVGRRTAGGAGLVAFADAECAILPGFEKPQGFRF